MRVRIFSPLGEMPFAGHPVIGTTFALAHEGLIRPGQPAAVLGLGLGPTNVDLKWKGSELAFAWMTQRPPQFGAVVAEGDGTGEAAADDGEGGDGPQ